MSPFPQYAKTDDPAVLAAVREIEASWKKFIAYAKAESLRLTGEEANCLYSGDRIGGAGLVAVRTKTFAVVDSLPGQWKKPDRGGRSPYRNNPMREEWDKHRHHRIAIPGRNWIEMGHGYMGTGAVIEWDGFVYSGFGFLPEDPATEGAEVWEEIRASEWHQMTEDVRDAEGAAA